MLKHFIKFVFIFVLVVGLFGVPAVFAEEDASTTPNTTDLDSLILAPEQIPSIQIPLTPSFDPQVTSYTASTTYGTVGVLVVPAVAASSTSVVTVNGATITDDNFFYLADLVTGDNEVNIVVTDTEGNSKTYNLVITREHFRKAPPAPYVKDTGSFTNSTDSLAISWSYNPGQYPTSEIKEYDYSVGTSAGESNVLSWVTVPGATKNVTITGLTLVENIKYYANVLARNYYDNVSRVGSTDGITVDTVNPFAEIVSPAHNAYVKDDVSIEVIASDGDNGSSIAKVEFFVDSVSSKIGEVTTPPFKLTWPTKALNVLDGAHTIIVRTHDIGGNTKEANVVVNVDNGNPAFTSESLGSISSYSATLNGNYSEPVLLTLRYGFESGNLDRVRTVEDYISSHTIKLSSLNPSTTYFYQSTIVDQAGNSVAGEIKSFKTSKAPSSSGGGGSSGQRSVEKLKSMVLGISTFRFYRELRFGMSGVDVKELQNRLKLEGLFVGTATEYFGAETLAAVKLYQAKYGLAVTGIVDQATLAKLNSGEGQALTAREQQLIELYKTLITYLNLIIVQLSEQKAAAI